MTILEKIQSLTWLRLKEVLRELFNGKVDKNTAIIAATKTKITYDENGLIIGGENATTADIAPSTDKNYVTDAELAAIDNPTTIIFNDPILTTSTSPVLVRSVNIGALNLYKQVIVNTETHSSNDFQFQKIKIVLRNIVDNNEIELQNEDTIVANNTIFKSFYINNSNIIIDNQYPDNYTSNTNVQQAYINNFTPNEDYVVEIYINAINTETITNRGLTIQLYK